MVVTTLLCLLGSIVALATASNGTFHLDATVSQMIVSKHGQVLVGVGNKMYRLTSDLDLQEDVLLTSRDSTISGLALSSNESRVVACLSDGVCYVYLIHTFGFLGRQNTITQAAIIDSTIALIAAPADYFDSFYIGSAGEIPGGQTVILLRQYSMDIDPFPYRSSETDFAVFSTAFVSRDFVSAFRLGSFVYFVVLDKGTEAPVTNVRIMRVCDDGNDTAFSALYEAILDCGTISTETMLTSVSLVDSLGVGMAGVKLVITISGGGQNRICFYSIADVNREMEMAFDECAAGDQVIPLAWTGSPFIDNCMRFHAVRNDWSGVFVHVYIHMQ